MIVVQAANQISVQQPLCEEWMTNPVVLSEPYMRSIEPDYKLFINPMEARRMGKLLKRALTVSLQTMRMAGVEHPDAIITGTGLGSVESTEAFLIDMCQNGEKLLKPTHFMQSTHNTIGSLVAIQTKTHGYNATYTQRNISFESALYDAWLQLSAGEINNALVGAHDALTPSYYEMLKQIGYVGYVDSPTATEASMAAMLSTEVTSQSLCEVVGVALLNSPDETIISSVINKLILQANLQPDEVAIMDSVTGAFNYAKWFGKGYSNSALGFYAAAHLLKSGQLSYKAILIKNVEDGRLGEAAITLLKKVEI